MNMDGAFLFGGRYNPPEIFSALYLSDSPEGCATEMKRRPVTPRDYLIGEIKVTVNNICDLTDTSLLEQLGIDPDELCKDEWELTQELGELIREAGFEGAIVPSELVIDQHNPHSPPQQVVPFLSHFHASGRNLLSRSPPDKAGSHRYS